MTLSHVDVLFESDQKLLDVLKERRDHNIGPQKLVVRSCRVHKVEYESRLKRLVKKVKWDNVTVVGSDYELTEDDLDSDDYFDDYELEPYYEFL